MPDLINVASSSPIPLLLQEPMAEEHVEKPGLSPALRTVTIAGKSHPDGPETVTRGVDAEVFRKWLDANQHNPVVANGLLREVSDDDADGLDDPEVMYGFEKGLEAAANDDENVEAAEQGSEAVHEDHEATEVEKIDPPKHADSMMGDQPGPDTHEEHPLETPEEPVAEEPRKPRFNPDTGERID